MKKRITLPLLSTALLMGCISPLPMPLVGADRDEKGCIPSAGYTWSELKQQCIQPFSIADIRLTDPENPPLAVYAILAEEQGKAEVFSANLPKNLILEAVKGGYAAKDKNLYLIKTQTGWELRKPTRS
ncbi:hypothetical protein [Avibacterium paragallinarum]|uniref:hypothetical protein n=1 Tax=Avibacterium paragallinarum TaxID=728 RepID=UPI0021F6BB24|nr:hypothetical protein [Avibacterium paragallinarum]UXN35284.1 hypothetical protein N8E86_03460 [Avibacterium paragallinarum]